MLNGKRKRKRKRKLTEWEKIIVNPISDKGLVPKEKKKTLTIQQQKDKYGQRTFPKKIYKMAIKHMKKCPTALVSREMEIKTTTGYHFTPSRTAVFAKTKHKNKNGK